MNSLTHADLETYLRRLVDEHLPSNQTRRNPYQGKEPPRQKNLNPETAKGQGDPQ